MGQEGKLLVSKFTGSSSRRLGLCKGPMSSSGVNMPEYMCAVRPTHLETLVPVHSKAAPPTMLLIFPLMSLKHKARRELVLLFDPQMLPVQVSTAGTERADNLTLGRSVWG